MELVASTLGMAPARSIPIDCPRQRRRIAQHAETGQIGKRPGSYLENIGLGLKPQG
jgi:hypothetical protein